MTDGELAEWSSIQGESVQGALGFMNDSQSPFKAEDAQKSTNASPPHKPQPGNQPRVAVTFLWSPRPAGPEVTGPEGGHSEGLLGSWSHGQSSMGGPLQHYLVPSLLLVLVWVLQHLGPCIFLRQGMEMCEVESEDKGQSQTRMVVTALTSEHLPSRLERQLAGHVDLGSTRAGVSYCMPDTHRCSSCPGREMMHSHFTVKEAKR